MATTTIDWNDPCARAAALREALYTAVHGGVASVSFTNGETTQTTTFHPNRVSDLRDELRGAEAECAAKTGARPPRHAIVGGARRW